MASFQTKDYTLEQRADQVHNQRAMKKIIPLVLGAMAVLMALLYVITVMYTRFGSFTVSVNKYRQLQYGLSLSETADFSNPTSMLTCRASNEITNIDGESLKDLPLGAVDGVDNGENYLCYTFYCRNSGNESVNFGYRIVIANMTLNIEKAVRVRLITSINGGEKTTRDYARAAGVDENNEPIPEPNTIPFCLANTVMQDNVKNFAPGDTMKITVVIWLEGNDPECINDIIGGEFKIDMKFDVTGLAETED